MKKQLFWAFAGLTSFAVSMVALAPLPVVAQQVAKRNPGMTFAGVSGSLWNGQVQRLTTPQAVINDLNWTLAPQKLLTGYLAADLTAEVKTVQVRGQCGISMTKTLHCSPLRAELNAANIAQLAPQAGLSQAGLEGMMIANLDDITWDRVTVPVANGRLLWDDGKVNSSVKIDLGGRYIANIEGGKDGKALDIELLSEDTAIVMDGEITVKPKGDYALELKVKAANGTDPMVSAAIEMVGAVQTDGSIRITQKGVLPLPKIDQAAE